MIVLSWNCRGLSHPNAIPNLRGLAHGYKPDVMFLSETLSHSRSLEAVRVLLGFDSCLAIDVEGRSGGLAVLWKASSKCKVENYSRNFINLIIEDDTRGEWRLSCYYGYPEWSRRRNAWQMLKELRDMSQLPWCIIGDFNDLLSQDDKKGIHPHPNWLCSGFRQAVNDCDLSDIHLQGYPYTWVKSRGEPHMVEERLDRAMATPEWLQLFPH
ncbi:endonuclease/exonuclease/phosphatase family protein, partial [Trifolium medium]|nr:endonuclease/exonuclease/phosphatase family protein [Trifolium medium]